eukprot:13724068-Alexandrium_andersonii.AAC.1
MCIRDSPCPRARKRLPAVPHQRMACAPELQLDSQFAISLVVPAAAWFDEFALLSRHPPSARWRHLAKLV